MAAQHRDAQCNISTCSALQLDYFRILSKEPSQVHSTHSTGSCCHPAELRIYSPTQIQVASRPRKGTIPPVQFCCSEH